MFSFLKKASSIECRAFLSGKVISITQVPDAVFSEKLLGDGIAIEPTDGVLRSPCDGTVVSLIEDSFHACGIKLSNGAEILLHIGLNTVEMKGDGFRPMINVGQKVKTGQDLIAFDLEKIREQGYAAVTMMVVTDMGSASKVDFFSGNEGIAVETVIARFE